MAAEIWRYPDLILFRVYRLPCFTHLVVFLSPSVHMAEYYLDYATVTSFQITYYRRLMVLERDSTIQLSTGSTSDHVAYSLE